MLTNPIRVPDLSQSLLLIPCPYALESDKDITPAEEPIGVKFPPIPTPIARAHHRRLEWYSFANIEITGIRAAVTGILSTKEDNIPDIQSIMSPRIRTLPDNDKSQLAKDVNIPTSYSPPTKQNRAIKNTRLDHSTDLNASLGSSIEISSANVPPANAIEEGEMPV